MELLAGTRYGRASLSLHALPFVTMTRHIVTGDELLLRMHRGHGYHRACDGQVIAYGADTLADGSGGPGGAGAGELWSVQCVGTAHLDAPADAELERLGPAPGTVDGEAYEPVYLRVRPRFATVHHIVGASPFQAGHAE
ncbi:pyridoxamine 5'-phosphate oxidase family protein [Streptomyces palmae]|uniref:Pyridoxamine 5'-phosphate oxidase family protein n=1 Tax=Streptomyces palmae TaxID=1701085 RepID=A0A4Z0GJN4_9ACTN|nr:pyridoxamine 5'-phosphate oxidase family protein [Streptomyces palmae]TGA96094.1 pyridoxamine 5'-phosphate oxidase family protein [Streptomyces palmae]